MTYKLVRYSPPLEGSDLRGDRYCEIRDDVIGTLLYLFNECCKRNDGKFPAINLIYLSQAVGLPLKTTCEFLEQVHLLPSGTWDRKFASAKSKSQVQAVLGSMLTISSQMERIGFKVILTFYPSESNKAAIVSDIFSLAAIHHLTAATGRGDTHVAVPAGVAEIARQYANDGLELLIEGVL